MEAIATHSKKMSIKSTIKFLLVALPVFGLLAGIGIGLIIGNVQFEGQLDLYVKLGAILLPAVSLVLVALRRYFKQVDDL